MELYDRDDWKQENDRDDTMTWFFNYDTTEVHNVVMHGKNDRRPNHTKVDYTFPKGKLTKLFLAHIFQGQRLLTSESGDSMVLLFTTKKGREFTDSTFVQFWSSHMKSTTELPYFCPSLARTSYVEQVSNDTGLPPEMWDGAATVMGNSVRQWAQSYNPSRRRRLAQQAVNGQAAFTAATVAQLQQQSTVAPGVTSHSFATEQHHAAPDMQDSDDEAVEDQQPVG